MTVEVQRPMFDTNEMVLNMGPQHPSTHGVLRIVLHLDGERLVVTYPNHVAGDVPDPLEILVTVTWNDYAGRERSVSMATLMTR